MSDAPRPTPKFPLRLDRLGSRTPRPPEPGAKPPQASAERRPPDAPTAVARAASTASGGSLLRPQRPVQHAAVDLARSRLAAQAASGLGLDSQAVRERMVARLQADGVCDPRVLAAMRAVPRHLFVDTALANQAYEDTSLPIGLGQTISKPSVVARMVALMLAPLPEGRRPRLLEIGSGCGYQAAVLAQLARQVVSVERLKPLYDKAREHLAATRSDNLRLVYGDGRLGHAPNAPYDGIIAAAGGDDIPPAWTEQLALGGRLVAPMADAASGQQVLVVIDRLQDGSLHRTTHEAVRFVPLKSGVN